MRDVQNDLSGLGTRRGNSFPCKLKSYEAESAQAVNVETPQLLL